MDITYLHQYFTTPRMSGGTRSYEMARRLVARGHRVTMITTDRERDDGAWTVQDVDGIQVHWLGIGYRNEMTYQQRLRAFLRFAWAASRRAASIPADIIFATSTPLTIALPAAYAKWRLRVPLVFEVRDLWPELPIAVGALRSPVTRAAARALEKFAYETADHVVALSPGMKEGVAARGVPERDISVIPNSSDTQLFGIAEEEGEAFRRDHDWLGERPLILYAGTFGRINGVGWLAEVAEAMLRIAPETRFLAVGEGYEKESVRAAAERTGVLGRNFFLMDPVAKARMPQLFSAATVATSLFVDLPAMWHNSANKFFDALAAGRPVAINYGGWQAELLEQSAAGIVMPHNDPAEAARILAKAIADHEWLKRARVAARRLAETEFDRDILAVRLAEILTMQRKKTHPDSRP